MRRRLDTLQLFVLGGVALLVVFVLYVCLAPARTTAGRCDDIVVLTSEHPC